MLSLFDLAIDHYYKQKAAGQKIQLKALSETLGLNYDSLRQYKTRYDKLKKVSDTHPDLQRKPPMQVEISAALRAKLAKADDAIAEYEAQQQIIWILIERLGGSVTIGDESMTTKRRGVIQTWRDEEAFSTTISLKRDEAVAA